MNSYKGVHYTVNWGLARKGRIRSVKACDQLLHGCQFVPLVVVLVSRASARCGREPYVISRSSGRILVSVLCAVVVVVLQYALQDDEVQTFS
jgi:prepilin signal peptidase PulO-like enzyme (type II secretory pathway)